MDKCDKQLLDIIQTDFPIQTRPYAVIGRVLALTEAETMARVRVLQQRDIIRRIGANFQSCKLGWKSTLCTAAVPEDFLEEFMDIVNEYPGVTHNYLRRHKYNIWFTYIGPTWDRINSDINDISQRTRINVLSLPPEKVYKIRVDFKMQEDEVV